MSILRHVSEEKLNAECIVYYFTYWVCISKKNFNEECFNSVLKVLSNNNRI